MVCDDGVCDDDDSTSLCVGDVTVDDGVSVGVGVSMCIQCVVAGGGITHTADVLRDDGTDDDDDDDALLLVLLLLLV